MWQAPGVACAVAAVGFHRLQETACSIGIKTGLAKHAHTNDVGLQFLLPGESRQSQLAAGQRLLSGNFIGQNLRGNAAGNDFGLLALFSLNPVIGSHMGHFMGNDSGHFRGIIGQSQQSTGDVKIAAWQCEGIDGRRIQNGYAVGLFWIFRNKGQGADDTGKLPFHLGIAVFTAIAGNDSRMFTGTDLRARVILFKPTHRLRICRWLQ